VCVGGGFSRGCWGGDDLIWGWGDWVGTAAPQPRTDPKTSAPHLSGDRAPGAARPVQHAVCQLWLLLPLAAAAAAAAAAAEQQPPSSLRRKSSARR